MATVPLSGTNIRLLSSVPFSNDYKHTRWFDNKSSQTSYFNSKTIVHSMQQANFQRIEGYNYIRVDKSIDELWGTNYLMFQNAHYNTKWFYAFVAKLEYVQRGLIHVHFQIDVFQTWKFDMNFKPSFVIREHCKLWNDDGSPVLNTVDEGIHYGTEYDNIFFQNYTVNDKWKWLVIVTKAPLETSSTQNEPSLSGYPQTLIYYCVPFSYENDQAIIQVDGESDVTESVIKLFETLYDSQDATNNIVSLYVTEHTGLEYSRGGGGESSDYFIFNNRRGQNVDIVNVGNSPVLRVYQAYQFHSKTINVLDDKYKHFNEVKESKLLMYPYTVTILDDMRGNRIELKNEFINSKYLKLNVRGSLGVDNKVSYGVEEYNAVYGVAPEKITDEHGLISNDPNSIPVLTDYLVAYLQGNRNSILNQQKSIVWNGMNNAFGSVVGGVSSGMNKNFLGVAQSGLSTVQGLGNTNLQLEGIQAKMKDIGNIPPQVSNMGGDNSYNFGNRLDGIFVIQKQVKPEYIKKLQDYFNMFGYKLNEVKVPNFHTRQNWNYIQTASCVITGNFNNEDLQELKNVFDSGITLWHTDDVGNYALDNEVI